MAEAACTPTVVITTEEAVGTPVAVSASPASPVTATRRRGRTVHLKQGYLVKKVSRGGVGAWISMLKGLV